MENILCIIFLFCNSIFTSDTEIEMGASIEHPFLAIPLAMDTAVIEALK